MRPIFSFENTHSNPASRNWCFWTTAFIVPLTTTSVKTTLDCGRLWCSGICKALKSCARNSMRGDVSVTPSFLNYIYFSKLLTNWIIMFRSIVCINYLARYVSREAYTLLAAMLTMRPWDDISSDNIEKY